MILRSLIITLALFLGYNAALLSPHVRGSCRPQSLRQANIVQAQAYVARKAPPSVVVVGTSMSARLPAAALGHDVFNLAMAGDSALTGLAILVRRAELPPVVVIETNLVMKPLDRDVVTTVYRPVFSQLRPYVPALQELYQPANYLTGRWGERGLRRVVPKCESAWARVFPPGPKNSTDNHPGLTEAEKALARQRAAGLAQQEEAFDQLADPAKLASQVASFRSLCDQLEQRGTRCVFLETPMAPSLVHRPFANQTRSAMLAAFPRLRYLWVRADDETVYATTDGLHLPPDEAKRFASHVAVQLAERTAQR